MFFREDNLKTQKRRHDRSDVHQCDVCNHVFSHPETLYLHKRNHHGQIGKDIKRNTTTTDEALIKRRITTYDDPEDSFSRSIIGEQKMPKFNTTSTKNKVTFHDLDIREIPSACQYNVQNYISPYLCRSIFPIKCRAVLI
jgi:hypothetical protein